MSDTFMDDLVHHEDESRFTDAQRVTLALARKEYIVCEWWGTKKDVLGMSVQFEEGGTRHLGFFGPDGRIINDWL